jgi:hypothetical protein
MSTNEREIHIKAFKRSSSHIYTKVQMAKFFGSFGFDVTMILLGMGKVHFVTQVKGELARKKNVRVDG